MNFIPLTGKFIQVVIETPKGSPYKYAFDPDLQIFRLKKSLPMGMAFPFDFGFIPNTIGGDGDPIDVLVIMDQPAYPGCLVECRALGVLMATQREKNGKAFRNDRILAISSCSRLFKDLQKIEHLNKDMKKEIQNFFVDYNTHLGEKFTPLKFAGANEARKLITNGIKDSIPKNQE